jgi:hypothetical protein
MLTLFAATAIALLLDITVLPPLLRRIRQEHVRAGLLHGRADSQNLTNSSR